MTLFTITKLYVFLIRKSLPYLHEVGSLFVVIIKSHAKVH